MSTFAQSWRPAPRNSPPLDRAACGDRIPGWGGAGVSGSPMSWKPFGCQLGALGPGGLESNPSSGTSQLGSPGKACPCPVFTHKTRVYVSWSVPGAELGADMTVTLEKAKHKKSLRSRGRNGSDGQ